MKKIIILLSLLAHVVHLIREGIGDAAGGVLG